MELTVNAHTHLELSTLATLSITSMQLAEWIPILVHNKRRVSREQMQAAVDNAIEDLLAQNVTAVGDITATGLTIEPLLSSGLRGVVFVEVLGREVPYAKARFREAVKIIETWRGKEGPMRIGLSIHSPYTCSPELMQMAADWCSHESVPLSIHVAESYAEVAYLASGTGPLAEMNDVLLPGAPHYIPGLSPIRYLETLGVLDSSPLLFHAVHVSDQDIATIKAFGCTVVHCPRSNFLLQCGRFPLERYLNVKIPVALGTDSLASSPSLNIMEELNFAKILHERYCDSAKMGLDFQTAGCQAFGILQQ